MQVTRWHVALPTATAIGWPIPLDDVAVRCSMRLSQRERGANGMRIAKGILVVSFCPRDCDARLAGAATLEYFAKVTACVLDATLKQG